MIKEEDKKVEEEKREYKKKEKEENDKLENIFCLFISRKIHVSLFITFLALLLGAFRIVIQVRAPPSTSKPQVVQFISASIRYIYCQHMTYYLRIHQKMMLQIHSKRQSDFHCLSTAWKFRASSSERARESLKCFFFLGEGDTTTDSKHPLTTYFFSSRLAETGTFSHPRKLAFVILALYITDLSLVLQATKPG